MKQSAALVAGVGLLLAQIIVSGQGQQIMLVIWNGQTIHNGTIIRDVLLELAFIAVLVYVAGFSEQSGNLILLFLAALWAAWLINHARRFKA
jgi:hypothetical protein